MPISMRGDAFQVTVNHNGARYRRSFSEHQDAKVWEHIANADLLAGNQPDMGAPSRTSMNLPRTIEEMAWYTYNSVWAGTPSDDKSQVNIKQVIDALGANTRIADVDVLKIDSAVAAWKSRGNANGTINRKLACLSKVLTKAKDLGIITKKPKLPKLAEAPNHIRWFTEDEKGAMYQCLRSLGYQRYVGLVRVLLETGLRCGELFRLQEKDIQGNLIVVDETKNAWPRSVPMTQAVREVIQSEMQLKLEDQATIFGWTKYTQFFSVWKKMQKALGWLDDSQATPHACRHTFVTNLVQQEVPTMAVQKLAGHKDIRMTMKYAHLGTTEVSHYMDRMPSAV